MLFRAYFQSFMERSAYDNAKTNKRGCDEKITRREREVKALDQK